MLRAGFACCEETPGTVPRYGEDVLVIWAEGDSCYGQNMTHEWFSVRLVACLYVIDTDNGVFSVG